MLASSSFKSFICTLFEKLNSNYHRTSILPHRLRPITSTLISPLRARKFHTIREKLRGKWPTVSSPFTTFTACLSMVLLNSHLATSFSPIDDSIGLEKPQAAQTLFVFYIHDSIALRFEPFKRMYENRSKIAQNSTCSKGLKKRSLP